MKSPTEILNTLNFHLVENKITGEFNEDIDEFIEFEDEELDQQLPNFEIGDTVTLLYYEQKPILTFPISVGTFNGLLEALSEGLNTPINLLDHAIEDIHKIINTFSDEEQKSKRLLYENNELTAVDLLGDYIFMEPLLNKENTVWVYGVGS